MHKVFVDEVQPQKIAGKGTGVVAVTDLAADVAVATEEPVAWAIDPEYEDRVCDLCVREIGAGGVKGCASCGAGGVCGECRVPIHDAEECKAYQRIREDINGREIPDSWRPYDLICLCRVLFRLYRVIGPRDNESPHAIWSLEGKKADDSKARFRRMAATCTARCLQVDKADIQHLTNIIETNAFQMSMKAWHRPSCERQALTSDTPLSAASVGVSVYYHIALFNHSCNPTLVKVPSGKSMSLVSLRPVAKGEELCHCYSVATLPTGKRRNELQEFWGFDCDCGRCKDPMDTWCMTSLCGCGGYLIQHPDDAEAAVCFKCGEWSDIGDD
ncbi:putative protein lysine methyltransferase SET6 [Diplonema papillatum]|nr:putative protein lysine methyltransferase SET6 [Diplonema papillatum]|eukprot:gene21018-32386_t